MSQNISKESVNAMQEIINFFLPQSHKLAMKVIEDVKKISTFTDEKKRAEETFMIIMGILSQAHLDGSFTGYTSNYIKERLEIIAKDRANEKQTN